MDKLENIIRTGKFAPDVCARINLPNLEIPVRAYVHNFGFEGAYGNLNSAKDYLKSLIGNIEGNFDYSLVMLWGEDSVKMADVFLYHDINQWPGNPLVSASWFKENSVQPFDGVTCGDGIILLGFEEQYRRIKRSLVEYVHGPPKLGELGLGCRRI